MLGIRNLSWEDLASAGIKQSEVSKVEYSKAEMSDDAKDQRKEIGRMLGPKFRQGATKSLPRRNLRRFTSFIGRDGKQVAGKTSLEDLSEKAIPVTFGKVKKAYDEWKSGAGEVGANADAE